MCFNRGALCSPFAGVTPALALGAALLAVTVAGCSSRQLYDSALGWQRNECHRLPDATERSQCLNSTATSFEDYKRQSRAARTSP